MRLFGGILYIVFRTHIFRLTQVSGITNNCNECCHNFMGVFGTLYDVGHASGPIPAGLLIGLSNEQDFRAAFAIIASLLIFSALVFQIGIRKHG